MKTYQINGSTNGGLFNYIEIPLQHTPINLSTLNSSLCAVIKISNAGGTLQVYRPNGTLNPFTTLDPGQSYVLLAGQPFNLKIAQTPTVMGEYDPSVGFWYSHNPGPLFGPPTTEERYWGGTIYNYNSSVTSYLSANVSLYTIKKNDLTNQAQIFTLSATGWWDHPLPLDEIRGVAHGLENMAYVTYKGDGAIRYYNNSIGLWFSMGHGLYWNSDSLVMSRSGNIIIAVASDIDEILETPSNLTVWIGTNSNGKWTTSNPGNWQPINLPGLHKRSRIEPDASNTGLDISSNFYVITDTHVFKIGKASLLSHYEILETHDFTSTIAAFPGSRGITDITSYRGYPSNDIVFVTIDNGTVIGKYLTSSNSNSFLETTGNTALLLGGQHLNCISYQELSNTLLVGVSGGKIFKTNDFGENWIPTNAPIANWKAINNRINGDVQKVYAVASPGYLYESNDMGMNWSIVY